MVSQRNKTIHLTDLDRMELRPLLLQATEVNESNCLNSTILGDTFCVLPKLAAQIADLAIVDPPYNLYKKVGDLTFGKRSISAYTDWLMSLLAILKPTLKPTATVYLCGDWVSSPSLYEAGIRSGLIPRNRITWSRKSPGAQRNWKNAHEDVWYFTCSRNFTYNVVKTRKKVLFPYKHEAADWTLDP